MDKQANSGNIPKSSASLEIGEHWLKKEVLSCLKGLIFTYTVRDHQV
jgi:hypothetical protein